MQHPTKRFLEQPVFESLRRWTRREEIPEVPLAATLGGMDAAGVRLGLVAAWWGPQGPLIHNDEVAAFVKEYPDRLVGVASVDLFRPMDGVRELRRCVRELGFRALRIVPWLWGLPPDDRRYYPLYAECIELDIPFCLQVGHTGPLLTSETGRPIPYLENVALEFP
ncbi:MAG: amidohydrolase family protein, partial [Acidobacteriota bacterium]